MLPRRPGTPAAALKESNPQRSPAPSTRRRPSQAALRAARARLVAPHGELVPIAPVRSGRRFRRSELALVAAEIRERSRR